MSPGSLIKSADIWLYVIKNIQLFRSLAEISVCAGNKIMNIYSGDFDVELKDDDSPLTSADKAAHIIIVNALGRLELDGKSYPLISEEGEIPSYDERKDWDYFWLIDPLDGTKEFVNRNGEFTVNIALIEKDKPVLGIVYIPVQRTIYLGGRDYGAYKTTADDLSLDKAVKLPLKSSRDRSVLTAAGSRSHRSEVFEQWVRSEAAARGCADIETVTAGSSLKFCLAAEGLVDVYPRFGPTMEWDTAAAHAVVEGAGLSCTKTDRSRMYYNKPNMKNDGFLVF